MNTKISNYDRTPIIKINGHDSELFIGEQLKKELQRNFSNKKNVLVIDCYPGVSLDEVLSITKDFSFDLTICSDSCAFEAEKMDDLFQENLTNDRVFGIMTHKKLEDFFYSEKLLEQQHKIESLKEGNILVYGVGASLITMGTVLILAELTRWEIQLRYRQGLNNWQTCKENLPILSKYKRGFFIEWRLADRHKKNIFNKMNYYMDMNQRNHPVMATSTAFLEALSATVKRPFRLVPYFDPGIWGGHWMKDTFGLPENHSNYAWCFDGVLEENSLKYSFNTIILEMPAINLVFTHPIALLGNRVHARFGTEFPIRFDFLDTMGGENLSLQVHPLTEYIQSNFHMNYTQDESYYIMEADDDACVYLGVKNNIDKVAMFTNLRNAEAGIEPFYDEKYVNCFPVKKHDHVLIPAGTIHCSGKNTVVLEISATPYIFTFKLWDWNRVGLDGLPRPVHLNHGEANIQWDRDTNWTQNELLHQEKEIFNQDGILLERTGLHEREFIDTYRYTIEKPVLVQRNGSVHMLNLVEGDAVTIHSPTSLFEDFIVHYAETFILPEAAKEYEIIPSSNNNKDTKIILACVK